MSLPENAGLVTRTPAHAGGTMCAGGKPRPICMSAMV